MKHIGFYVCFEIIFCVRILESSKMSWSTPYCCLFNTWKFSFLNLDFAPTMCQFMRVTFFRKSCACLKLSLLCNNYVLLNTLSYKILYYKNIHCVILITYKKYYSFIFGQCTSDELGRIWHLPDLIDLVF